MTDSFSCFSGYEVILVKDERELFQSLVQLVRITDPDVLLGFSTHHASWGYLSERATIAFNWNICNMVSRLKKKSEQRQVQPVKEATTRWERKQQSSLSTTGRLFLTVRKAVKAEINVTSYTLENFVYHILHQR